MNIIIVGCGQVGVRISSALCRLGHDVAVISRSAEQFDDLPDDFDGITISGVPMDLEVLKSAGIVACDVLAAVTPDDNLNIVISQIAHEVYNVPNVVTRIVDPTREGVFEDIGLKTVCPTKLVASTLLNVILGNESNDKVMFGTHTAQFFVRSDKHWTGRKISQIPAYDNEIIYGVYNSDGSFEVANNLDRIVEATDRIVFSSIID